MCKRGRGTEQIEQHCALPGNAALPLEGRLAAFQVQVHASMPYDHAAHAASCQALLRELAQPGGAADAQQLAQVAAALVLALIQISEPTRPD